MAETTTAPTTKDGNAVTISAAPPATIGLPTITYSAAFWIKSKTDPIGEHGLAFLSSNKNSAALKATSSWAPTIKLNLEVNSSQRCSIRSLKTAVSDHVAFTTTTRFVPCRPTFLLGMILRPSDGHTVSSFTRWWPQWQPERNNNSSLEETTSHLTPSSRCRVTFRISGSSWKRRRISLPNLSRDFDRWTWSQAIRQH